jgi:hypothetical protein
MLMTVGTMAQNTVKCYIDDFSIAPGEKKTIAMNLTNPDNKYCAFQFDLQLPDGIAVDYNEQKGKFEASLAAVRNASNHGLSMSKIDNSTYRFVCFSTANNNLKGTDGALVEITLVASADAAKGEMTGNILNAKFTPKSGKSTVFGSIPFKVISTTDIKSVKAGVDANAPVYNLAGQKVNKNFKGVVIQNGKKVVK